MAAPGTQHMGMGALWFVGGSAVTLISANSGGRVVIVTFGAILIGLGQFLYGLVAYLGRTRSPIDAVMPDAGTETRAMARAMVTAAQGESGLDETAIALIRSILKQVDGVDYLPETIRNLAAAIRLDKLTTDDYLAAIQNDFTAETKRMILRGCTMVMSADGRWNAERHNRLVETARAMQTSPQDFDAAISGILQPAGA